MLVFSFVTRKSNCTRSSTTVTSSWRPRWGCDWSPVRFVSRMPARLLPSGVRLAELTVVHRALTQVPPETRAATLTSYRPLKVRELP